MSKYHNLTKEQQKKSIFFKGIGTGVAIGIIFAIVTGTYDHVIVIPQHELNVKEEVTKTFKTEYATGYVTSKAFKQGDDISSNDLIQVQMPIKSIPKEVRDKKISTTGKVLRIAAPANTLILPDMLVDKDKGLSDDVRRQDYSQFKLSPDQKKGDYVDIRIRKKDGSDQIFASKKLILDLANSTIYLQVNESERTYINNAIVEAALDGSILYTTTYVDPQNQPVAQLTYKIDPKVEKMIKDNANIVNQSSQQLNSQNTSNQTNPSN